MIGQMASKDEHLALSSGIGLAGVAVSNFEDCSSEAFGVFKEEIIECILKPTRMTAIHYYLYFYQDIEDELDKLCDAYDARWIYNFMVVTLDELNINPELSEPDFENCRDVYGHSDCECNKAIQEWKDYVIGNQEEINKLIIHAAFQVIFQSRKFLYDFHLRLATFIEEHMDEIEMKNLNYISSKKRIKRQYFPEWLKSAVFYRDKGTCSQCRCDLSNLIRVQNTKHIDHIIPLDMFGSNDASNFQLLCESCNTSKGAKIISPSSVNAPFWNL